MPLRDVFLNGPDGLTVLDGSSTQSDEQVIIQDALTAVRKHFEMPVAYLSEFIGEELIFRSVSAPGLEELIKPGDIWPLSQVYCPRVLSGEFPQLIQDTNDVPACQALEVTKSVPIRSHISLPVRREDGSAYGMFCCLSPQPNPTLNGRDLAVMSTFANLATRQVRIIEARRDSEKAKQDAINTIIEEEHYFPVFQPLVDIASLQIVGLEALTRFEIEPDRSPDMWFADARAVGREVELELATLVQSLRALPSIPGGTYLSINASPDLTCDPRLQAILSEVPCDRILLELTEHAEVADFERFLDCLMQLRGMGVRIAIDDVGTGYSGLSRIAQVRPDVLKIDKSIAKNVDTSPTQRAIIAAMKHLAIEINADLLVEGVETSIEAETLIGLGVGFAQGWLFGRPVPLEGISELFEDGERLPAIA